MVKTNLTPDERARVGLCCMCRYSRVILSDRGSREAEDLPIDEFSARAAEFFQAAGWGRVTFRSLHDALAVIDIEGCWEAQLHGEGERGCHLTTGTLAGFLGCLADYPVAVMEIECQAYAGKK